MKRTKKIINPILDELSDRDRIVADLTNKMGVEFVENFNRHMSIFSDIYDDEIMMNVHANFSMNATSNMMKFLHMYVGDDAIKGFAQDMIEEINRITLELTEKENENVTKH